MSPVRRWSSEWHRPDAANRISTSPSLGGSRSRSMISQSLPMSLSTAALVFIEPPASRPPVIIRRLGPAVHVPRPKSVIPRSVRKNKKIFLPNEPWCLLPPQAVKHQQRTRSQPDDVPHLLFVVTAQQPVPGLDAQRAFGGQRGQHRRDGGIGR